jgi:hypothetical protein
METPVNQGGEIEAETMESKSARFERADGCKSFLKVGDDKGDQPCRSELSQTRFK